VRDAPSQIAANAKSRLRSEHIDIAVAAQLKETPDAEIYQYILNSSPSSEGDDGFRFQRVNIQCGMGMLTRRFRSFDTIRYRPSSSDSYHPSVRVVRRECDSRRYDHARGSALVAMSERPGRLVHAYARDYIRSDRRGSGIEV
jgi:hypothetical protein